MIGFLRNLVIRDFWLKLFSLALAILIWKIISPHVSKTAPPAPSGMRAEFNVPLNVVSSAGDVHDFKVSPSTIEVTVSAESKIIQDLKATDIRAQVDLTGIEAAHDLRKHIEVSAPPGVTVVWYDPNQADIIVPPKKETSQTENP